MAGFRWTVSVAPTTKPVVAKNWVAAVVRHILHPGSVGGVEKILVCLPCHETDGMVCVPFPFWVTSHLTPWLFGGAPIRNGSPDRWALVIDIFRVTGSVLG